MRTHHHLLVVANETVEGNVLIEIVRDVALSRDANVFVVAPALNSRLRHWMSDSDCAHSAAQQRLENTLARLRGAGVRASGEVGDADPLRAIEDAIHVFPADEIVIGTTPRSGRTGSRTTSSHARARASSYPSRTSSSTSRPTRSTWPPSSAKRPSAGCRASA
jgi:nucleotide-binding universal stress UspA family protein